MSTLTVYPTRRKALKAAYADAAELKTTLHRSPGKRPPFYVFGEDVHAFTSRTNFKPLEAGYRATFQRVVEVDSP